MRSGKRIVLIVVPSVGLREGGYDGVPGNEEKKKGRVLRVIIETHTFHLMESLVSPAGLIK